jgi:hypothetical protein
MAAQKQAGANNLARTLIKPPKRWEFGPCPTFGADRSNSITSTVETYANLTKTQERRRLNVKGRPHPTENSNTCLRPQTSRKLVLGQFDAREILKDTQFAQQSTSKGFWNQ